MVASSVGQATMSTWVEMLERVDRQRTRKTSVKGRASICSIVE